MHINVIKSGSKNQYLKHLLRVSYRVGRSVKKRTLMNLGGWSQEAIDQLATELSNKRNFKGTESETEVNNRILAIFTECGWDCASRAYQLLIWLNKEPSINSTKGRNKMFDYSDL